MNRLPPVEDTMQTGINSADKIGFLIRRFIVNNIASQQNTILSLSDRTPMICFLSPPNPKPPKEREKGTADRQPLHTTICILFSVPMIHLFIC